MQDMNEDDDKIRVPLAEIIEEYISNVNNEFRHLWNSWDVDMSRKEVHEVVGGIIARQVSLAIHFLISPSNWNNEIAPIILRSMTDNYINLAWILKEPQDRSRKFIAYGLGQEKLIMEHRKKQVKEDGITTDSDPVVSASMYWINMQQFDFLTIVDIASWSGISVYQMAEDAGCKYFYNYVYQPFSVATHNMWNHIGKHNVRMSDNPLHKHLFIPIIPDMNVSLSYSELAAKYVDKCFDRFHTQFNVTRNETIAYNTLLTRYEELSKY